MADSLVGSKFTMMGLILRPLIPPASLMSLTKVWMAAFWAPNSVSPSKPKFDARLARFDTGKATVIELAVTPRVLVDAWSTPTPLGLTQSEPAAAAATSTGVPGRSVPGGSVAGGSVPGRAVGAPRSRGLLRRGPRHREDHAGHHRQGHHQRHDLDPGGPAPEAPPRPPECRRTRTRHGRPSLSAADVPRLVPAPGGGHTICGSDAGHPPARPTPDGVRDGFAAGLS